MMLKEAGNKKDTPRRPNLKSVILRRVREGGRGAGVSRQTEQTPIEMNS